MQKRLTIIRSKDSRLNAFERGEIYVLHNGCPELATRTGVMADIMPIRICLACSCHFLSNSYILNHFGGCCIIKHTKK